MTARVSPNGLFIGFDSLRSLTGYDNNPASHSPCEGQGGEMPCQEIFLYEAAAKRLRCVSCDPAGAAPAGPASIRSPVENQLFIFTPSHLQRNVLDDGRVFFDTPNALLSIDGNGRPDVYEYQNGDLHLISSGTSSEPSFFYDASLSGDDAYFVTTQQLLSQDTDGALNVYDARVGGGLTEPPATISPCGGQACRAATSSAPPPLAAPGSALFSGPGNLAPPVSGPVAKRTMISQKLVRALKSCRSKHNRHKRAYCESRARKRYGATVKTRARAKRRAK
jgi:hypothetical protein